MARTFDELSRAARVYAIAVTSLGAIAIVRAVVLLVQQPARSDWLALAALIILTGAFSIRVPSAHARLSVSKAVVFASVLSFGPHVATVIVALDFLILTSRLRGPSRAPWRVLFHVAAAALAISCATQLLAWMLPALPTASVMGRLLVQVFVLALSYFAINSWLITLALALERQGSALDIWRKNFPWLGLNYLGGASVAFVLVSYLQDITLTPVSVMIPLLLVLYLTFRTASGRLEDGNKHVTQLNELYLSTVEALVMVVSAKDQPTHSHIRRVQVYAVELARRVGVHEDKQIKAIEAAALLHDMGKLGVPEHILNKPGRLTDAEFDCMKQHVNLGADLLSSIRFPYPVVPIVRHHHENWDGSGYPSAIAGTDIPLGARILSVVDCFDALTSDRPYRPRLTTAEAFDILRERRGTMYDPLVVDTFLRTYAEIAPIAIRAGQGARSVFSSEFHGRTEARAARSLRHIRATATASARSITSSQDIARAGPVEDALVSA